MELLRQAKEIPFFNKYWGAELHPPHSPSNIPAPGLEGEIPVLLFHVICAAFSLQVSITIFTCIYMYSYIFIDILIYLSFYVFYMFVYLHFLVKYVK